MFVELTHTQVLVVLNSDNEPMEDDLEEYPKENPKEDQGEVSEEPQSWGSLKQIRASRMQSWLCLGMILTVVLTQARNPG